MIASETALRAAADVFERARARRLSPVDAMRAALRELERRRVVRLPKSGQALLSPAVLALIGGVLEAENLTVAEVAKQGRGTRWSHRASRVRDEAIYLCRLVDKNVSFPTLGVLFRRDHSSLVAGQRSLVRRMETDELLARRIRGAIEAVERQRESAKAKAGGAA